LPRRVRTDRSAHGLARTKKRPHRTLRSVPIRRGRRACIEARPVRRHSDVLDLSRSSRGRRRCRSDGVLCGPAARSTSRSQMRAQEHRHPGLRAPALPRVEKLPLASAPWPPVRGLTGPCVATIRRTQALSPDSSPPAPLGGLGRLFHCHVCCPYTRHCANAQRLRRVAERTSWLIVFVVNRAP